MVQELNRITLTEVVRTLKGNLNNVEEMLVENTKFLHNTNIDLTALNRASMQQSVHRLRGITQAFTMIPLPATDLVHQAHSEQWRQQRLEQIISNLEWIDQSVSTNTFNIQDPRVRDTYKQIFELKEWIDQINNLPPEILVAPFNQKNVNIYGQSTSVVTFYAPSVFALIIQHISITLGALSMVRERLIGVHEVYSMSPTNPAIVLTGKYIAHTLFVGIIVLLLSILMTYGLNVPFRGNLLHFVGISILVTFFSLGIGYIISILSKSDSQSIQMSMIFLLYSIFFGGLFLPLESFNEAYHPITFIIPLVYGIRNFHLIMLGGQIPNNTDWIYLSASSISLFSCAIILWIPKFRDKY